ncbi:MAG: ABC transporter ATP-binding protein, partial [Rhodospirillales bacterium]|nr:ABC transporter ATP-binding protein [Rhodospirillales bacterium]
LQKTILFVTHDFDEALRLADRIAIMKDGIIEQIDTPANIILNPSTEYVAKFTNEVPREKVLHCENIMEDIGVVSDLSDLRVPKDAIIETVAEAVLNEKKPTAVVDKNNQTIGVLRRRTILHILFGDSADLIISNPEAEAEAEAES